MKIKKAILYTYFFAVCFTFLYYFLNKYFVNILSQKFLNKSVSAFQAFFYFPFVFIYMWIPGLVALYFAKKEKIKIPIFKKFNKYYFYGLGLPIIFIFLIIFVSMIFSKIDLTYVSLIFPPSFNFFSISALNYILYFLFLLLLLLLYGCTINTFIALGQEIMWRGYLVEKFKKFNFWHSSLIIGVLWGIWHFPITIMFGYYFSTYRFLTLIWMLILTVLSTPLYIYLRQKGKSVLVSALFYGIFNSIAPYSVMFFNEPNQLLVGASGFASFIVWLIVNFFLYLMMQKKLKI
ncbi:MAG: Abortive infection protein [uncultured bacterium]|nr:MAG: Abortive infection protein [uncultured bacterium]